MLKDTGRAAVIVPDNVLFERGAGEKVRRSLLRDVNFHTLLRLPAGLFYASGIKANVVFFDACVDTPVPRTTELWVYDLRTDMHFTLKNRQLTEEDLADFLRCFGKDRQQRKETWNHFNPRGRWRRYGIEELLARPDVNLDLTWLPSEKLVGEQGTMAVNSLLDQVQQELSEAFEILGRLRPPVASETGSARSGEATAGRKKRTARKAVDR